MLATVKTLYFFSWQPAFPPASCDSREQDWGLAATPKWKGNWPCTQLPESPNKWHLLRGPYEIKNARLLSAHIIPFINCTNQQCFQHKDSLGVASRGEGQKKKIPTQQCCQRQCSMQSTSLGTHPHLWLGNTACSRKTQRGWRDQAARGEKVRGSSAMTVLKWDLMPKCGCQSPFISSCSVLMSGQGAQGSRGKLRV